MMWLSTEATIRSINSGAAKAGAAHKSVAADNRQRKSFGIFLRAYNSPVLGFFERFNELVHALAVLLPDDSFDDLRPHLFQGA